MGVEQEISPETRLLLIKLAEGFAEGVRNGTFEFGENSARRLIRWAEAVMQPDGRVEADQWQNATEICDYIGFTPQTLRSYVRKGRLPKGEKRRGYTEPMWRKEDVEDFAGWYFSHRRKG